MNPDQQTQTCTLTRRSYLQRVGKRLALTALTGLSPFAGSGCNLVSRPVRKSVKVGILHSETGTMLATSVGEDELRSFSPFLVKGHYSAWSYFQSLDTPSNREFVSRLKQAFGYDCVTDDPIEAAYSQVSLWKLAVEQAGSFVVDKVRDSLHRGIEWEAPGGKAKIDPKTQHAYKRFRLGRIREDRQFDIVYDSKDWIAPDPYPQIAFPGWDCDWTQGGLTRGPTVEIGS